MVRSSIPRQRAASSRCALTAAVAALALLASAPTAWSQDGPRGMQQLGPQPVIHNVSTAAERLEMIVNSSRILTLDKRIPRAQVNNPNILELTPLSATQVQIHARAAGVTQVNLWDENDQVHSIDVMIYADARELAMMLESQFPKAALKVVPLANSVIIHGYVDDPNQVNRIIEIAQQYHPNVINNITVGGVQQVLLQVKVMEVSRTKLRRLGIDLSYLGSSAGHMATGLGGLLSLTAINAGTIATTGGESLSFAVMDGSQQFHGFLDCLRQDNLAKLLAEPNLVTVSGRPAYFNVGGEFPIIVPQSLGTVSIEYRSFGTQIDFVPIVLGNGGIRLEVRPRVSEIDDARGVQVNGLTVPALRVSTVDTGVEMRAGQTLAIAGLIQNRTETQTRGVPGLSELPYLGALFRRVSEENNEIELLILVTPHLVDAMNPCEVPQCGPGMATTSPSDCDLFWRGHIEVPAPGPCGMCNPGSSGGMLSNEFGGSAMPHGAGEMVEPGAIIIDQAPSGALPTPQATPDASAQVPSAEPAEAAAAEPATIELPSQRRQNRHDLTMAGPTTGVVPLPAVEKNPPPGFIGPVGYDVVK